MRLTLITATCDRPEAFAICERWMARQTLKPVQWLVLDDGVKKATCAQGQEHHYWPEFRGHGSMVKKIKRALEEGLIKGDGLIFWEDDDYQSADWIEWCAQQLAQHDLIGEANNLYYNVRHRWWFEHANRHHASLCATACRRSVFPQLLAECNYSLDPFIDSRLWANCQLRKHASAPAPGSRRRSIGIKAMPGTKGYGSGHDRSSGWAQADLEGRVLRSLLGPDADVYLPFYEEPRKNRLIPQAEEMPVVEVHLVTFNEEMILPYTLRHYKSFASRIIVHDGGSTDGTLKICADAGVEVEHWDTGGKINDTLLRELKENAWKGTKADWVIMADADEFIHCPSGWSQALAAFEKVGLAVVKPQGWEMVSDSLPSHEGQIYDHAAFKSGGRDDRWYAKPIMFSPKRVIEIKYSAGAHECIAKLRGGLKMGNPVRFTEPTVLLLHYHHLGSVERIGARYDGNKSRFSQENIKHGWGWNGDGFRHAQDKRTAIMKTFKQVIP